MSATKVVERALRENKQKIQKLKASNEQVLLTFIPENSDLKVQLTSTLLKEDDDNL